MSADVAAPQRLTVGYVPGVTLTKWARIWSERFHRITLETVPVDQAGATALLHQRHIDMCFVRLPVDRAGLHLVPLYTETAVVLVPKDHPASVFEKLTLADLVDEPTLNDVDPAIAADLVAGGAGILLLPQSVARSYSRRDLTYRPVIDAPATEIGLAWCIDRTSDLTEEFVGVVRGRSATSSRSPTGSSTGTGKK